MQAQAPAPVQLQMCFTLAALRASQRLAAIAAGGSVALLSPTAERQHEINSATQRQQRDNAS